MTDPLNGLTRVAAKYKADTELLKKDITTIEQELEVLLPEARRLVMEARRRGKTWRQIARACKMTVEEVKEIVMGGEGANP